MADELDGVLVARSVLDLLDLAYQCVTVGQRGRTSLADKDAKLLRDIVGRLSSYRDAHAAKKVGRKIQVLTPDMQALGWLRRSLDQLCLYAVKQPPSDERDALLARSMEGHFIRAFDHFRVDRRHIDEAFALVKQQVAKRAKYDKPGGRPKDWLRLTKDSDNRGSAMSAAGEILRVAVEVSGATVDASLSVSSTADYAKKVVVQLRARTVRRVTPLERLGYLMTVLGVPLEEVPWVAWLVGMTLAGRPLLGRKVDGTFPLICTEPNEPVPFRLLDTEAKVPILAVMHRRLVEAGFPADQLTDPDARLMTEECGHELKWFTGSKLWGVVESFIGQPSVWAGKTVSDALPSFQPRENPWAPK